MGLFIPHNLTSVAIFSAAGPDTGSPTAEAGEARCRERREEGASSSYKAVASGPCSVQGRISRLTAQRPANSLGTGTSLSSRVTAAAAHQCEGRRGGRGGVVQRHPHNLRATGRETAHSHLLRLNTASGSVRGAGLRCAQTAQSGGVGVNELWMGGGHKARLSLH